VQTPRPGSLLQDERGKSMNCRMMYENVKSQTIHRLGGHKRKKEINQRNYTFVKMQKELDGLSNGNLK
jgi:hypothetical protein